MDHIHYLFIGLAAFIGEIFGTIFGGGSFLIQPALLSAGVSPHMAVANDVTAAVFSCVFFTLHSARKRKPDMQVAGWMLPGVTIGALMGGLLLAHIPDNVEKWIILGICCAGLVYMLIHIKHPSTRKAGEKRLFPYWRVAALAAGIGLGIYEGVSGAGSGVIFITVITFLFKLDMKSAVFVTNFLEIIGLGTAALTYWYLGLLDAKLLAIMIPACCVAGVLGSKIVHAVSERTLRIAFACCISLMILYITLGQ